MDVVVVVVAQGYTNNSGAIKHSQFVCLFVSVSVHSYCICGIPQKSLGSKVTTVRAYNTLLSNLQQYEAIVHVF